MTWLAGSRSIIPAGAGGTLGTMAPGRWFTVNLAPIVLLQSNGSNISKAARGLRIKKKLAGILK